MNKNPHSLALRKGRISIPGQIYSVTMVTRKRNPVFSEFNKARIASRLLYSTTLHTKVKTLAHVVMPDHIHWLLSLKADSELREAVRLYRAKVSLELGERIWQDGFHDRALRYDEDLVSAARYIVRNPVRAGFVQKIGLYPHWDAIWV